MSVNNTTCRRDDPFSLNQRLEENERQVRDAARIYFQDRLAPLVLEAFRHEKADPTTFRAVRALVLLVSSIPEQYGGAGLCRDVPTGDTEIKSSSPPNAWWTTTSSKTEYIGSAQARNTGPRAGRPCPNWWLRFIPLMPGM